MCLFANDRVKKQCPYLRTYLGRGFIMYWIIISALYHSVSLWCVAITITHVNESNIVVFKSISTHNSRTRFYFDYHLVLNIIEYILSCSCFEEFWHNNSKPVWTLYSYLTLCLFDRTCISQYSCWYFPWTLVTFLYRAFVRQGFGILNKKHFWLI